MAYWLIQLSVVIIFSSIYLVKADNDIAIFGLANVITFLVVRTLSLVFIPHFMIRFALNKLRANKEVSTLKTLLLCIPLIFAAALIDNSVRHYASTTFKPAAVKAQYLANNPQDSLIAKEDHTPAVPEKTNAKEQGFVNGFKKGFNEGYNSGKEKAATAKKTVKDKNTYLKDFVSMLFLYAIWTILYLPLSALKNRFAVKRRVKETQLALLMSQLNPHFLFNSLNSIRGMVFENKELAKELVDKLNALFKYNLASNKKATAKLSEELRVCEFYLDIEHIRLEERLLIEMHIDESCNNVKVPTMGLLTLLENAIKHAIAPRIEQSLLTINIHKDQKHLYITVKNPVYQGDYQATGTGTGQSNLLTRLQLMYESKAWLKTHVEDQHYIAELAIPLGS